jgi:hypothetical protein
MSNEIILYPAHEVGPAALFTPTPKAAKRVLEFFAAQMKNEHDPGLEPKLNALYTNK